MTRAVRFFVILGVGLLAFDGVLYALTMNRAPVAQVVLPRPVSSGTALVGGPFTLISTDGATVNEQTYRGKWMLIYFGYTSCPDACPTVLSNLGVALQKLGAEASNLQPLFVTVDPKRDTRGVLGEYLKSFDPRIVGLTGSEQQTNAVAKTYKVYFEAKAPDRNGYYLVDHTSFLYLMDPRGKFVDVIEGATPPVQVADWVRKAMRDNSTCEASNTCNI